MLEAKSTERIRFERAAALLVSPGRALFSLAIVGLGIETLCARDMSVTL